MKKRLITLCAGWLLCLQINAIPDSSADEPKTFSVILKLDDMVQRHGAIPDTWQRVYDYADHRGIPFSVGVIGNSLEGEAPEYFDGLKSWSDSGFVELWNHGYDHKMWEEGGERVREFRGSGYEHQYDHLKRSQDLAQEKLRLSFVTFGPPFNNTDEDTK
ncbi:MAG: DUF2334 domain-containing protein, partial [Puniceicoccales bacterium]